MTKAAKQPSFGVSGDLYSALVHQNPELLENQLQAQDFDSKFRNDNYPGMKDWLIVQYALGTSSYVIKAKLEKIIEEQKEMGVKKTWKHLSKRLIDDYRNELRPHWEPKQSRLVQNIENTGLANKNQRILALARTAERIEEIMDEDRDKGNRLYLFKDYTGILRQIAEEKGELGSAGEMAPDALMDLMKDMFSFVKQANSVDAQAEPQLPDIPAEYRIVDDSETD